MLINDLFYEQVVTLLTITSAPERTQIWLKIKIRWLFQHHYTYEQVFHAKVKCRNFLEVCKFLEKLNM